MASNIVAAPEKTLAEYETAAPQLFAKVRELGAAEGKGIDALPALAIFVANSIANGTMPYEKKGKGKNANKNIFDRMFEAYATARAENNSNAPKADGKGSKVATRLQKVGEAAESIKTRLNRTSNQSFGDMLTDALKFRAEHKDGRIWPPFDFIYRLAQEQVRPSKADKKAFQFPDLIPETEWLGILSRKATVSPEAQQVVETLRSSIEKMLTTSDGYRTVAVGMPEDYNEEAAGEMRDALKSMADAVDQDAQLRHFLEVAQSALQFAVNAIKADKAAAETDAKAAAEKAAAEKAEADRKAQLASMTEEDLQAQQAQFMAEWRAARGMAAEKAAEPKPNGKRKQKQAA